MSGRSTCCSVLAYSAEEAERLSRRHVGPEDLLLGILREGECFAAEMLLERGLSLSYAREVARTSTQPPIYPEHPRPAVFVLKAVNPKLTMANPSHPTGFHEGPGRDGKIRASTIWKFTGWLPART